jgi:hypothetical protein
MSVYNELIGKKIKVVWEDNFRDKALVGILNDYLEDDKAIVIFTERNQTFLIKISQIKTLNEVVKSGY